MPFDVLVIGAGQIAAGYDSPDSAVILTHAHALVKNADFRFLGFYDTDVQKAETAAKKWNVKAYGQPIAADVIAVCTPDSSHLGSIRQAIALKPKLIILEKPIADDLKKAEKILELTKKVPMQVNFTRRFVLEFQRLAKEIRTYGSFLAGTGLYGKGFLHNGSHMIDLLRILLGEIKGVEVIKEINDFFPNDATKTAMIRFERGGEFFMCGIDCRCYTVFELELCFEKARIRILDSGERIQIESARPSEKYKGYTNLVLKEEVRTEIDMAISNLYKNSADFLTNRTNLLSPIEDVFVAAVYTP